MLYVYTTYVSRHIISRTQYLLIPACLLSDDDDDDDDDDESMKMMMMMNR